MGTGTRLWILGAACLFGGFAGRIALGWYGIGDGRRQYAEMALWQLFWYAVGWLLIAAHLSQASAARDAGRIGTWGRWSFWWVGVLASGFMVLSACPP